MKKNTTKKLPTELQIVIIVFVGAAIIVGLLFTFMYVFYIHDWCPSPEENVLISPGCVLRYPEKYADKYVQVAGTYQPPWYNKTVHDTTTNTEYIVQGAIYGASAYFGSVPASLAFTIINGTNLSNLTAHQMYHWYGIVRITREEDKYTGTLAITDLFLEVSKIEKVNV